MRATAPAGAAGSNASARSATPPAADAATGSKSFSDVLVGTPARAGADSIPTATGGKPSPKTTPRSIGDGKTPGPAAASDSKAAPAHAADTAAATKGTSAAESTAAESTAADSTAAGSSAAAAGGTDARAAATASPLLGTTVSPSAADDAEDAEDAHDADTVIADEGLTNLSTPTGAAAARPAARRTSSTDTAASTNLVSAQTVWLMAASAAANSGAAVAAPPATLAATTSAESIDTATALAALTGTAGAADTAPVGSSWTGGDNAAAAAAASFAATDEGASGDTDASGNGAPASPDRARASTDVSSDDLPALAQLVRGVSAGGAQTGGIERSIGTPVTDPGWSRDVAAQVQMMASSQVQSATLRLSPEHLGPVEVHIDMQASQINVNFVAAHPDTRSALEQSVPTLRAMLAHGGLTLGQTQVQGEARSGSQSAGGRARDNALPVPGEEPMAAVTVRGAGLIDEYA